jgi:hypothetical protein
VVLVCSEDATVATCSAQALGTRAPRLIKSPAINSLIRKDRGVPRFNDRRIVFNNVVYRVVLQGKEVEAASLRVSSAASVSSQSRKRLTFATFVAAFGQTIQ